MSILESYGYIVMGIFVSILLPILKKAIPVGRGGLKTSVLWPIIQPYFVTGVYSFVVGIIILATFSAPIGDWNTAFLAGYASDSTLQKLK